MNRPFAYRHILPGRTPQAWVIGTLLAAVCLLVVSRGIGAFAQNWAFISLTDELRVLCPYTERCFMQRSTLQWDRTTFRLLHSENERLITQFEQAQRWGGSSAYLAAIVGWLLQLRQADQRAEEQLQLALTTGTQQPEVYNRLGDLYSQRGDVTAAVDLYQTALAHFPGNRDAQIGLLLAELQTHEDLAGKELIPPAAVANLLATAAVAQDPSTALLVGLLGQHGWLEVVSAHRLLVALAAQDVRTPQLERAWQMLGSNPYELALLAQATGRWAAALAWYEQTRQSNPPLVNAFYRAGMTALAADDRGSAIAEWTKCVEQLPDHLGCLAALTVHDPSIHAAQWRQQLHLHETTFAVSAPQDTETGADVRYSLEPTLLNNGDFEAELDTAGGKVRWYQWTADFASSPLFGEGIFLGVRTPFDSFRGDYSLYLAGLWAEPTAGYGVQLATPPLTPGRCYLLRFAYRTGSDQGRPVVYVPLRPNQPQQTLPFTRGQWHTYALAVTNDITTIQPVGLNFRVWGEQELWVDDVRFQAVGDGALCN
jgi:tetratricopeptide (TPR) repeat protein